MTDKKLAKKIRELVERYMEEFYPPENKKEVNNKVALEVVLETMFP